MSGELRLTRITTRWVDRFRKYRVEIDGQGVAEIEAGHTLTFDLAPGSHKIRLTLDETVASESISFSVRDGELRRFMCGPKQNESTSWTRIFNFSSTINLEEVD